MKKGGQSKNLNNGKLIIEEEFFFSNMMKSTCDYIMGYPKLLIIPVDVQRDLKLETCKVPLDWMIEEVKGSGPGGVGSVCNIRFETSSHQTLHTL